MRYKAPEAFRSALEARLNEEARANGRPLAYLRKWVAFERFLARVFFQDPLNCPFVLKGAFALSLRVQERRTTRDLDLALTVEGQDPVDALKRAVERDAGDFFRFRILPRTGDRPQEPAARRLTVEALLAERVFESFKLDVATEPVGSESVELRTLPSSLEFAEIQGPRVRTVHPARHYADKLHAYTRPRRHRSRVKDLVDLALLTLELEGDPGAPERIHAEVAQVYSLYPTHNPWGDLPPPPGDWKAPFRSQAREVGLDPPEMRHWFDRVEAFYRKLRP